MVIKMVENKHSNETHTTMKSVEWIQQNLNMFACIIYNEFDSKIGSLRKYLYYNETDLVK